jgi:hypothetical protein
MAREAYDSESIAEDIADAIDAAMNSYYELSEVFQTAQHGDGHAFMLDTPGALHRFKVTVTEVAAP